MKTCTTCGETKPLDAFSRNKGSCKPCSVIKTRERQRTRDGLVVKIAANQRQSARHRSLPSPSYTTEELKQWMFAQPNFESLYLSWVASGYDKYHSPSCDRLDNSKGYSLDNLQLVTFKENFDNEQSDFNSGKLLSKTSKPIKQYDLNGNFIQEFASAGLASRTIKANKDRLQIQRLICAAARRGGSSHGYKWEFV